MTGLRATNFSSGQGIAYMHESLYAAVGKRLTYVLNVAARAMTKHALNVHAGHDDYHAVDDTGFFQLFAKDVQEAADLNLIAHRIAELSLNPGICRAGRLPHEPRDRDRCAFPSASSSRQYLGDPSDLIESPTPAQRLVFGETRRRIPEMFDFDYPAMLGVVQNQDSYAQGVAAQRPFYFDHVAALADRAFDEYATLTGRRYARAMGYRLDDAEWVIVGQGSVVPNAEAVADHLRDTRGLKVGVLNLTMFRPFPADLVTRLLAGKKGVVVLERTRPAAGRGPADAARDPRRDGEGRGERPGARRAGAARRAPGPASRAGARLLLRAASASAAATCSPATSSPPWTTCCPAARSAASSTSASTSCARARGCPKLQIWQETAHRQLSASERPVARAGRRRRTCCRRARSRVRIHSVGGWGAITMGKNLAMTAFELFGLQIKANPKYGSEKKGQPTTFYAVLAHEPIRLNCELKHVDVVLSPDPNVFRHSDPLAGLAEGGVFVIQSDLAPDEFWQTLPARGARARSATARSRLYVLDAFAIAREEASDVELRYRMQGAAFMGAFFRTSSLLAREGSTEAKRVRGHPQAAPEEVRRIAAKPWWRTTCA